MSSGCGAAHAPGDVLLLLGAGDIDRAVGDARRIVKEQVDLSRYTTIGTGGPARWFAQPETVDELVSALAWAREQAAAVEVIGLGSNVLVHDDGVDALVLKLGGELAAARVEDGVLTAGGGAPNAVCLHRARAAGLGGFEFASAIPGTAGGGVRMNAGAYGSDWSDVVIDAVVVDADGARTVGVEELGLSYRHSGSSARPGGRSGAVPPRPEHAGSREGEDVRCCSPSARRRSRPTSGRSGASSRTPARGRAPGG